MFQNVSLNISAMIFSILEKKNPYPVFILKVLKLSAVDIDTLRFSGFNERASSEMSESLGIFFM